MVQLDWVSLVKGLMEIPNFPESFLSTGRKRYLEEDENGAQPSSLPRSSAASEWFQLLLFLFHIMFRLFIED